MARGDKSSYTDRQKRKARHIEEGYEERGVPEKEAERRAWRRRAVQRLARVGRHRLPRPYRERRIVRHEVTADFGLFVFGRGGAFEHVQE